MSGYFASLMRSSSLAPGVPATPPASAPPAGIETVEVVAPAAPREPRDASARPDPLSAAVEPPLEIEPNDAIEEQVSSDDTQPQPQSGLSQPPRASDQPASDEPIEIAAKEEVKHASPETEAPARETSFQPEQPAIPATGEAPATPETPADQPPLFQSIAEVRAWVADGLTEEPQLGPPPSDPAAGETSPLEARLDVRIAAEEAPPEHPAEEASDPVPDAEIELAETTPRERPESLPAEPSEGPQVSIGRVEVIVEAPAQAGREQAPAPAQASSRPRVRRLDTSPGSRLARHGIRF